MEVPTLYLTSISLDHRMDEAIYAPDPIKPGQFNRFGSLAGVGRVTLEMEMDLTPGADQILKAIQRNGHKLAFGAARHEFRCIWCGVCNPVERPLCSQCGGPRGWIL